jgi:hypothetical protein
MCSSILLEQLDEFHLYSEFERVYPALGGTLNMIIVSKLGAPSDEPPKMKSRSFKKWLSDFY